MGENVDPDLEEMKLIERFQKNLPRIRQSAGLSIKDLAQELDVSRQTVYELESGKRRMSKIQYLAIRFVLMTHGLEDEDTLTAKALDTLVDAPTIQELTKFNQVRIGPMSYMSTLTGLIASGVLLAAPAIKDAFTKNKG